MFFRLPLDCQDQILGYSSLDDQVRLQGVNCYIQAYLENSITLSFSAELENLHGLLKAEGQETGDLNIQNQSSRESYFYLLQKHHTFIAKKFEMTEISAFIEKLHYEMNGPDSERHYQEIFERLKLYVPHFIRLNKVLAGQAVDTAMQMRIPGLAYELLRLGASQDYVASDRTNLLMRSVEMGEEICVQFLLATGKIALDEKDKYGSTAFDYAKKYTKNEPEKGRVLIALLEEAQKVVADKSAAEQFSQLKM
jgi:hypothetical protein